MKKKILIVDDSSFMRKVIRKALEHTNLEIIEGASGMEALSLYEEHHPDVVSLDITMEGMDGIKTLDTLLHADKQAKVIICSSMTHPLIHEEVLSKGAKAFIKKPFSNDEYASLIHSLT